MPQHRQRHRSQIVASNVVSIIQDRSNLGSQNQSLQTARTGSVANVLFRGRRRQLMIGMSRHDQSNPIPTHISGDRDHPGELRHLKNAFAGQHGVSMGLEVFCGAVEDRFQIRNLRILHQQLHKKPVQLRFGQWIRAFHFQRILSRHDEERF